MDGIAQQIMSGCIVLIEPYDCRSSLFHLLGFPGLLRATHLITTTDQRLLRLRHAPENQHETNKRAALLDGPFCALNLCGMPNPETRMGPKVPSGSSISIFLGLRKQDALDF